MPYKSAAKRRRWQREHMRKLRQRAQQHADAVVVSLPPTSAVARKIPQPPPQPKPPTQMQQPQRLVQLSPLTWEAYKVFRRLNYGGDVVAWLEEAAVNVLKRLGYKPSPSGGLEEVVREPQRCPNCRRPLGISDLPRPRGVCPYCYALLRLVRAPCACRHCHALFSYERAPDD